MNRIHSLTRIALGTAFLAVCSWITLPATIPFTLQSFGLALILLLLGGKRGTAAWGLYLLLGAAGLPVFSGGHGGIGALFGITGGYLLGFLALTGLFTALPRHPHLALCLGTLLSYAVAVAWTALLYANGRNGGEIVLAVVVPYVLPDAAKLIAAMATARRLRPHLHFLL